MLPPGNTATTLNEFTIPKGTEVFIGRVKDGGKGATQVFIKDPAVLKNRRIIEELEKEPRP